MIKSPLENFCPVPRDQRPFYQYLRHKEFFSGENSRNNVFSIKELLITGLKSFLISFISFILFFLPQSLSYENILEISTLNFVFLFCYYLYIFINYILTSKQLFKSKVLYEESTWFDINTWIKPVSTIRHERLINEYQMLPGIKRLQKIVFIITLLTVLDFFCLILF